MGVRGPKGGRRAEWFRNRAMRALLASDGPLTQAELIRTSGLRSRGGLSNLGAALHDAGLVTYQVQPTYELKTSYRLTSLLTVTPRTRDLTRTVIGFLNALIVAGRVPLVVSRDDIEDQIIAQPQWHGRFVRDTLQRVVNRLADAGLLERVQDYCEQSSHSVLTVDLGQRERLRRIVRAVDDVAAGDMGAIKAGVRAGRALLADPGRVRALMARGFGSSKQVTNPVSRGGQAAAGAGCARRRPGHHRPGTAAHANAEQGAARPDPSASSYAAGGSRH